MFHSLFEVLHATSVHESCTFRIRLTTRTKGQMQTQVSNERTDGRARNPEPVGICDQAVTLMAPGVSEMDPQF